MANVKGYKVWDIQAETTCVSMSLLGEAIGHLIEACESPVTKPYGYKTKMESVRMHETCTFKISYFSLSRKPDVGSKHR